MVGLTRQSITADRKLFSQPVYGLTRDVVRNTQSDLAKNSTERGPERPCFCLCATNQRVRLILLPFGLFFCHLFLLL